MKETYIILRDATPSTGDIFFGTLSDSSTSTAPSGHFITEIKELGRSEPAQTVAGKGVKVAAPSMPIGLIMPVETANSSGSQPLGGNSSWGVAAVGADTSPFDGSGVVVAVLDTGIDRSHPRSRQWQPVRSWKGTSPAKVTATRTGMALIVPARSSVATWPAFGSVLHAASRRR